MFYSFCHRKYIGSYRIASLGGILTNVLLYRFPIKKVSSLNAFLIFPASSLAVSIFYSINDISSSPLQPALVGNKIQQTLTTVLQTSFETFASQITVIDTCCKYLPLLLVLTAIMSLSVQWQIQWRPPYF